MKKWICLDCETTGINPEKDEILSLSALNKKFVRRSLLNLIYYCYLFMFQKNLMNKFFNKVWIK